MAEETQEQRYERLKKLGDFGDFVETMNRIFPEDTEVSLAIDGVIWKTKKLACETRIFLGLYPVKK